MISIHGKDEIILPSILGEILGRLERQSAFRNRYIFGKTAAAKPKNISEDRIPWPKLSDVSPTASTHPAMSAPRMVFLGLNSPTPIRRIGKGSAVRKCQSLALMEAAWTFTST